MNFRIGELHSQLLRKGYPMIRSTLAPSILCLAAVASSHASQEFAVLNPTALTTQLKILICQKSDAQVSVCDDEHAIRVRWVPIPPNLELSYCTLQYGQSHIAERGLVDPNKEYVTIKCVRR